MKNKEIYYNIYSEFYNVNKFRELKTIVHHGNNRLNHINRVAKMSFFISKKLNLDFISCTRGAIMHDFFTIDDLSKNDNNAIQYWKKHPNEALQNSSYYFEVNEVEKDIILSHMFPITKKVPAYPESKIVCISDKVVSIYELLRYQLNFSMNLAIILCIKFLHF